jgi:hypothetical protein
LRDGRDTGIAVNHACIEHQKTASEKPNPIRDGNRALRLTRTGLEPVGSRQFSWRTGW